MLANLKSIHYSPYDREVAATAAGILADAASISATASDERPPTGLAVGLSDGPWGLGPSSLPSAPAWMWARVDASGNGEICASKPALLMTVLKHLLDGLDKDDASRLPEGLLFEAPFDFHRPVFDYVLAQSARNARKIDDEAYIRAVAECGFTHLEVNAIQAPFAVEDGVPNEYYAQFYTYCAGLNYFVESKLTRGLYPIEYLTANLNHLKHLAALGRKYGLKPGILCFEPRTLPERFFRRYPTLRGARVDHPFRSHLPRYTLAQDHPVARAHYREMITNLMNEVPDLAYMSVYTNDSGAGFEHTASLYVGRNGGPYMIREWRNHEKIAKAAGESAVSLLRDWREAAAAINPEFEIVFRIEPFKVEHDTIMAGMGDGLTIEAPSMLVRGYHLPYNHFRYPEIESAAGTIFHTTIDPEETEKLDEFRRLGFEPKLTYSASGAFNMEPLLGIPFPKLLRRKLDAMADAGFRHTSVIGGLLNIEHTPYWPNAEVLRRFQLSRTTAVEEVLAQAARRWAGDADADRLVDLWNQVEEAVTYIPLVMLYGGFGFVWLRTWVRPFTPNLEAVPREDRQYFERFMVSTPNNPSINDLGRDVLFQLITRQQGETMSSQFDQNVLPRIEAALENAKAAVHQGSEYARPVFVDLLDRIRALRCWTRTQRNTCAWVAGVYGYMEEESPEKKEQMKQYVQDMIDLDLENTKDLLDLWETSNTECFLVSDIGETAYIYGENIGQHLRRKIELTERYRHVEPGIDRDIIWRLE